MIVTKLKDVLGTKHDVKAKTWNSRRLVLADAKMGFSVHDTIIKAGTSTDIWYQNHLESVYCIQGAGEVELVDSKEVFRIEEGTIYSLDKNDQHILRADPGQDMRMVCVFNPPLTGEEVHDENGVYPILDKAG